MGRMLMMVAAATGSILASACLWRLRQGSTHVTRRSTPPPLPLQVQCQLLTLPYGLLLEISGWLDFDSEAPLFDTCRALQELGGDPAVAALRLLHASGGSYSDGPPAFLWALCHLGVGAVGVHALVQQVLWLLRCGPDSGGPHVAPPFLLPALLHWACLAGDVSTVCTLMALPQPPDLDAEGGRPLLLAVFGMDADWFAPRFPDLQPRPRVTVVQALLECGTNPCAVVVGTSATDNQRGSLFAMHAVSPAEVAVLQLLLQHCPAEQVAAARSQTLRVAAVLNSINAAALLLPAAPKNDVRACAAISAAAGSMEFLQMVMACQQDSPRRLHLRNSCLVVAAENGQAPCVALLLNLGAEVDYDNCAAFVGAMANDHRFVILNGQRGVARVAPQDRRAVVRLLLEHGATITPHVHVWAEAVLRRRPDQDLWGLLLPQEQP